MSTVADSIGGFSGFKMRLIMVALLISAAGMFWQIGRNVSDGRGAGFSLSPAGNWTVGSAKKIKVLTTADRWGGAMVRIGITFVAAVVLGGLTRAYFKSMISLAVLSILVIAFLHYKGLVEPFWEPYVRSFGDGKQWIVDQTKSFTHFVHGAFVPFFVGLGGFALGLRR